MTLDMQRTALDGVVVITPRRFADARGHFCETYSERAFAAIGVAARFVQDNQSFSLRRGTVRGLHYQAPPHAQGKLVRVLRGAILDAAVDARRGSPTYGRHVAVTLSAANGAQLYVPAGFLHGFVTLEPDTEVAYKVTDFWSGPHEGSVLWNDPDLGIDWGIAAQEAVLSEKDAAAPRWRDFFTPF